MPSIIYYQKGKFSHTRGEPEDNPPAPEPSTRNTPSAGQAAQAASHSYAELSAATDNHPANPQGHHRNEEARTVQTEDGDDTELEPLSRVPTHRERIAASPRSVATVALSTGLASAHRIGVDLIAERLRWSRDEDSLARQAGNGDGDGGLDGLDELDELEPLTRVGTNRQGLAASSKAPATVRTSQETAMADESPVESKGKQRGIVPSLSPATVRVSSEVAHAHAKELPADLKAWCEQRLLDGATRALELVRRRSRTHLPHTSSRLRLPPANSADLSSSAEKAGFPSQAYKKAVAQLRKVQQVDHISIVQSEDMASRGEASSAPVSKKLQLSTSAPVADMSNVSNGGSARRSSVGTPSDSTGEDELPINYNSVDKRGRIRWEGPYNRRPSPSQPPQLLPKAPLPKAPLPVPFQASPVAAGPVAVGGSATPPMDIPSNVPTTPSSFHNRETNPAAMATNGAPHPGRDLPFPDLPPPYVAGPSAPGTLSTHGREPTILRGEPVNDDRAGREDMPSAEHIERIYATFKPLDWENIDIYGVSPPNDAGGSGHPSGSRGQASGHNEEGARLASGSSGQAAGSWTAANASPGCPPGGCWPSHSSSLVSDHDSRAGIWSTRRNDEHFPSRPPGRVSNWVYQVPAAPSFVSTWSASQYSDVDVVMPDAVHPHVAPWDEVWPSLASVAGSRTPDEVVSEPRSTTASEPVADMVDSWMSNTQDQGQGQGLLGGANATTAATSSRPLLSARSNITARRIPPTDEDYARLRGARQARRRGNAADHIHSSSPTSDEPFVSVVRPSQDSASSGAVTSSQGLSSSQSSSSSQVFGPSRVITPSEVITTPYPMSVVPSPQPWDSRLGPRPRNMAARTPESGKCDPM